MLITALIFCPQRPQLSATLHAFSHVVALAEAQKRHMRV